jgi:hypothetical protein
VTPAAGGNFITLTPDKIWLYSADLQLQSERDLLLSSRADEGWWQFNESPNGKYLLVMNGADRRTISARHPANLYYNYQWIELGNLRVLHSWQENTAENLWKGKEHLNVTGGHVGSLYDDEIVIPFYTGFLVRKLDGPLRLVPFSRPVINDGVFGFLSSELLISQRRSRYKHEKGDITLIRRDGEVLFQQQFSDREQAAWLERSIGGRRFALAIYRGKGGSEVLDIAAHYTLSRVMVYDVPSRQWVYTLDAKAQSIKDITGLALSPDASSLALIDGDGVLKLYDLPRATASGGHG